MFHRLAAIGLPALLAVLFAAAIAAPWYAGQAMGERDEPDPPMVESFNDPQPPVDAIVYGYEGINERLGLGTWGRVTAIEATMEDNPETPEEDPREIYRIIVDQGGQQSTVRLDAEGFVRVLSRGQYELGDVVATAVGEDGITVLVHELAIDGGTGPATN